MGRKSGFTLIELMVVMMVVVVIAAIVVPRVVGAGRQARESQLLAQLKSLRNAIATFGAQCGGYPAQLPDLIAEDATGMVDADGIPVNPQDYKGPYFTASPTGALPIDPTTGLRDWAYEPSTGAVHSGSTGTAIDGSMYSDW